MLIARLFMPIGKDQARPCRVNFSKWWRCLGHSRSSDRSCRLCWVKPKLNHTIKARKQYTRHFKCRTWQRTRKFPMVTSNKSQAVVVAAMVGLNIYSTAKWCNAPFFCLTSHRSDAVFFVSSLANARPVIRGRTPNQSGLYRGRAIIWSVLRCNTPSKQTTS